MVGGRACISGESGMTLRRVSFVPNMSKHDCAATAFVDLLAYPPPGIYKHQKLPCSHEVSESEPRYIASRAPGMTNSELRHI